MTLSIEENDYNSVFSRDDAANRRKDEATRSAAMLQAYCCGHLAADVVYAALLFEEYLATAS